MEKRRGKSEYNQAAFTNSLQNYIAHLASSGSISVSLESGKVMDGVAKDFTDTFKKATKKMAKDAGVTIDDYFDNLNRRIESGISDLKGEVNVMFDEIIDTHEQESKRLATVTEKAQKHYLKHVSDRAFKQAGDAFKSATQSIKQGLTGQASASTVAANAFSKLSQSRASLVTGLKVLPKLGGPIGLTMAGFAGGAAMAAASMYDLSEKTGHLYRSMGTNQKELAGFIDNLVTLRGRTHLSTGALVELAESFHQVGITSGNTKGFADYLAVAGKAVRLTEMNSAVAATYVRTLRDQGRAAGEVEASFDTLYRTMQDAGASMEDFNDTVAEGTTLFKNYGAVVGGSLERINQQILETKGLFKALGIDAKTTGQVLGQTFSDPSARGQRAMFLQATLGGNFSSHYLNETQDISKSMEDVLGASLIRMQQQMGSRADALTMTPEQRRQKFGDSQAYMLERQIDFAQKSTAAVAGIPREVLNNVQVEYTAWLKEAQKDTTRWVELQKGGAKEVVKAFIEAKKAQQMATEPAVGWQDAFNNANSTFAETSKELGRTLQSLGIILASTILPILNPILKITNGILDAVVLLAGAVQPLLTWMMKSLNPLIQMAESWDRITESFKDLFSLSTDWVSRIGGASHFSPQASGVATGAKEDNFFTSLLKGFEKLWNDILDGLRSAFPFLFGSEKKKAASGGLGSAYNMELTLPRSMARQPRTAYDIGAMDMMPSLPSAKSVQSGDLVAPPEPIAYDAAGNVIKNFKEILPPDARNMNYKSWGSHGIEPWTSGRGKKMTHPPGFSDNVISLDSKRPVGYVSARGESGNPGIVNMDPNPKAGWDYGAWQFNAKAGIPQAFVKWMKKNAPDLHGQLAPHLLTANQGKHGAFGQSWKNVNAQDPKRFLELQRQFAWDHYLGGVTKQLGPELGNIVNSDRGMQEMAFSTAIQHGVGGAAKILRRAGLGSAEKPNVIDQVYARRAELYPKGAGRYEKEAQTIQNLVSSGTAPVDMNETNQLLRQLIAEVQKTNQSHGKSLEEMRRASLREDDAAVNQMRMLGRGTV